MKATPTQQLKLLEMQECDTKLARLSYDAEHLPEHEKLSELTSRLDDMTRFVAKTQSELGDRKREQQKIKADIERLLSRQKITQSKLDRGLGDMRELSAMQSELETIARRLDKVEYENLEAEEAIQELSERLARGKAETESLTKHTAQSRQERDQRLTELRSQAQPLIDKRKECMSVVGEELTAEYEAIRKSTGGLGAVALRGRTVEGMSIQFTAREWDRIRSAAPDDVITSEDMEWILVRVED